ncbi:MAG: response regulator [Abitibacteriaceae bacterium]|nr:response regulator [Abditibacteriaceae bacterium]
MRSKNNLAGAKFLIVDDELVNIRVLERLLEEQNCLQVRSTTDPCEALPLYLEFCPDIILLDLMMPVLDGFGVMDQLKGAIPPETYLPVLVLTADISPQTKRQALAAGAKDFLTKPFDSTELLLRIGNLLETRFFYLQLQDKNLQLQDHNQSLAQKVHERTCELEAAHSKILKHMREVEESQIEVLDRLARAAEFRDDDTQQHTQRVALAAALLAKKLGLPQDQISLIQRAALLHDVGKIGVSDLILLKSGKLTDEEIETMKTHAQVGAALLAGGRSELVQMAERIARTHHERWDGSGYPNGLKAEAIPVEGRILAIVDVFDALTHDRPYKKAWPVAEALAEITRQSGRHFDPHMVAAFLSLPHDILV